VEDDEFVLTGPPEPCVDGPARVDVGLNTALVTIDAKDGPPGFAPGAVGPDEEEVVVPGKGGN
jgi:hypothetical protein